MEPTVITRPASWPLPKPGKEDRFGFAGTDRASLERQYGFYLRAYGLPVCVRTNGPDGEPQYAFGYAEEGGQDIVQNLPARVVEAITYLIDALSSPASYR